MSFFKWQPALDTGISIIDEQHHQLVEMINDLHDAMSESKGQEVVSEILEKMISYTAEHFHTEEKYMQEFNYPDYASHKQKHDEFVAEALGFKQKMDAGKEIIAADMMHLLKDWLFTHIAKSDKAYVSLFKEKGL